MVLDSKNWVPFADVYSNSRLPFPGKHRHLTVTEASCSVTQCWLRLSSPTALGFHGLFYKEPFLANLYSFNEVWLYIKRHNWDLDVKLK